MENTPNYNLNLPDYEDFADVEKLNENFEIIDTQMKSTEDALTTHLDNSKKWVNIINTSSQTIPNNTSTDLIWGAISNNNGSDFATLDGGQIKLKKGVYTFYAFVSFLPNSTGDRTLSIAGAFTSVNAISTTSDIRIHLSNIINATADGYIVPCKVTQTSGGALDLRNQFNNMRIRRVADL